MNVAASSRSRHDPEYPEDFVACLVDWSIVSVIFNTPPPRDPNDDDDEDEKHEEPAVRQHRR
jgi:hypothetical protein